MNSLYITRLARIRLNLLSEFMDSAVYGLDVLHPPGVFTYLPGAQYDTGISHEIEQQGKFPVAQAYGLPTYLCLLPGGVNVNIPYPEGGGLRAGWVIVVVVFGISPELGISEIDDHGVGTFAGNAHIRTKLYHTVYILFRGV